MKTYSSIGGITLQSPWLMVLAKQACGETYFFKEEVNSPEGNIAAANSLGDCEPCPGRSTCPGGLALPIVKEGYWQEASAVIHLSKRPLRCDPVTACTGGSRVSECFESAATLEVCGQSSSFATAFSTRSPNAPAAATGSRGKCPRTLRFESPTSLSHILSVRKHRFCKKALCHSLERTIYSQPKNPNPRSKNPTPRSQPQNPNPR